MASEMLQLAEYVVTVIAEWVIYAVTLIFAMCILLLAFVSKTVVSLLSEAIGVVETHGPWFIRYLVDLTRSLCRWVTWVIPVVLDVVVFLINMGSDVLTRLIAISVDLFESFSSFSTVDYVFLAVFLTLVTTMTYYYFCWKRKRSAIDNSHYSIDGHVDIDWLSIIGGLAVGAAGAVLYAGWKENKDEERRARAAAIADWARDQREQRIVEARAQRRREIHQREQQRLAEERRAQVEAARLRRVQEQEAAKRRARELELKKQAELKLKKRRLNNQKKKYRTIIVHDGKKKDKGRTIKVPKVVRKLESVYNIIANHCGMPIGQVTGLFDHKLKLVKVVDELIDGRGYITYCGDGLTRRKYPREYSSPSSKRGKADYARPGKGKEPVEEDSYECIVCLDRPKDYACVPCGHQCLCEKCSRMIGNECPICRKRVENVIRVYL